MRTNNRFKLTCYYVRGRFEIPIFETSSLQQLEIKIRGKAGALLVYPFDPTLEVQRDYLSIQITRCAAGQSFTSEICRYSRSTSGDSLWAY